MKEDNLQVVFIATIIMLVLLCTGMWKLYRYHECKHVGHSTLYCVAQ